MLFFFRIPDLVKDPEAEAAFEALRGLVEACLQKEYEQKQIAKQMKKPTARKSTGPNSKVKKKSTARKSTTSYSRGEFSYYGIPQDPVDFKDISTRMSIGGMEITLNASKMAGLVNLKPTVLIQDCKTQV